MLFPTRAKGISCRVKKAQCRSAVSFSSLEKEGVEISSFNSAMASDCKVSIEGLFMTDGCTGLSGYELIQFLTFSNNDFFYSLPDSRKRIIQFWDHTGKNFLRFL